MRTRSPDISKREVSWYKLPDRVQLSEKAASKVEFETQQIDRLLHDYGNLLESARRHAPELVERTALASVLHSFYTGVEAILTSIAKDLDGGAPSGQHSHRRLLDQMSTPSSTRGAVLTDDMSRRLYDYLSFRHFYRHGYSFFLDWEKMESLVSPVEEVWAQLKKELRLLF